MSLTADNDGSDNAETDLPTPSPEAEITDRLGLYQALSVLSAEDRRLIYLRYFRGRTQSVTASALGMTQVQVSRREKKLLAELKALMTRES